MLARDVIGDRHAARGRGVSRSATRTILVGLGITLAALMVGAIVALVVIHLLGARELERVYHFPAESIEVPSDADSIREGERLAGILGCRGCHRPDLAGGVFFDGGWLMARLVAPNLSTVAPRYSDDQLAWTIRHGMGLDGRALLGMPSAMYYHLSDRDLGALIAWLRTVPPRDNPLPDSRVGPLGRLLLLQGEVETSPTEVAALGLRMPAPDRADEIAWGRYLATTSCSECHGQHFEGEAGFTPPLAVAAGYDEAQFRHFMQTGEALGGRELRLMSEVARDRFSLFTDEEIQALHAYLRSLADPT
jgi:mono/diheme cytochrome c family protein